MRIALFYTDTESFNFFTNQLEQKLRLRGHETFILNLLNPPADSPHSYANFVTFASQKVDAAICFDGMCIRDDILIGIWNAWNTIVVDILMDPPLRFHPSLKKHPANYLLFCCDYDHVDYVKRYFKDDVSHVAFMPHVGAVSRQDTEIIPFKKRKYDILFSATYYSPQSKLTEMEQMLAGNNDMQQFYHLMYRNLIEDSDLTTEQAVFLTLQQVGWTVSDDTLKTIFRCSEYVDWAIRMYQREQIVSVLAESGLELYLLGRGWENHSSAKYPNVHRIADRVPYAETLTTMADAKINLNVFPWFKSGTHDRIFNTLLQHSLPLTDSSRWVDEHFTDGQDIVLYDLKNLEQLPEIAGQMLRDPALAEGIIQKGYKKVLQEFTWSNCTDWILSAINKF